MANFTDSRSLSNGVAVEARTKAQRVAMAPRGYQYKASGVTGTIAAALAANAAIFALRPDPGVSPAKKVFIDRVRITFTTLVAFTVPLTAGRRLAIFRSTTGAAPTGGTVVVPVGKNSAGDPVSKCAVASGGTIQIATTAGITMTGITLDTNPLETFSLVHVGNAGNVYEYLAEFPAAIQIEPGQVLAITSPQAMDAAGTWQAAVNIDFHEATAWEATVSE